MKMKRMLKRTLAFLMGIGCLTWTVSAAGVNACSTQIQELNQRGLNSSAVEQGGPVQIPRATESFSVKIAAHEFVLDNGSFPLEAGETVTINAVYSPASASVEFGLVTADGVFHYLTAQDGQFNESIRVDEAGQYRLGIQNNSSSTVQVTGFVNY